MQIEPEVPYKSNFWRKLFVSLTLALLLLIIVMVLFVYLQLRPPAAGDQVTLTIPQGAGSRQIATILEQNGLIRDGQLFYYALKLQNEGDQFKAGTYTLSIGLSQSELIAALNQGQLNKTGSVRLTVPEGMTMKQLGEKLESQLGLSSQTLFREAKAIVEEAHRNTSAAVYPWMREIPLDNQIIGALEGYLFPDTYEFESGVTEREILQRLLKQMDAKLQQLPTGWEAQLTKLNINLHQFLTIASIIEREVVVSEERPVVAGVLYNRLKQNMPMQSCATVQYLLPNQKSRLLNKDLEIESPYNTYRNSGFPPGPIANPGLAAMKAAAYPADTPYLFFVTRNDGSSGHYFAKTYAEHNQNIARSRQ